MIDCMASKKNALVSITSTAKEKKKKRKNLSIFTHPGVMRKWS
jgi:hypothetical protein